MPTGQCVHAVSLCLIQERSPWLLVVGEQIISSSYSCENQARSVSMPFTSTAVLVDSSSWKDWEGAGGTRCPCVF